MGGTYAAIGAATTVLGAIVGLLALFWNRDTQKVTATATANATAVNGLATLLDKKDVYIGQLERQDAVNRARIEELEAEIDTLKKGKR